jgi:hypothetical protein
MQGYSAIEVFRPAEIQAYEKARRFIDLIPDDFEGKVLRCHELARAVGICLSLPAADGSYGSVEHSWVWTKVFDDVSPPNIIDVYAVGRLPMVQLVDYMAHGPRNSELYKFPCKPRDDIDAALVDRLVKFLHFHFD